jgi:DNA-dependent RNA polymerase auxiliary subunit epsilon
MKQNETGSNQLRNTVLQHAFHIEFVEHNSSVFYDTHMQQTDRHVAP